MTRRQHRSKEGEAEIDISLAKRRVQASDSGIITLPHILCRLSY
ncbi:hypothetical protein SLEP1_g54684 [Rubroshorea leprosula]|nr:hypothetical protein SLEP1_g54684 [Rubroshorea leprosula]